MRQVPFAPVLLLVLAAWSTGLPAATGQAPVVTPVIVELFHSEGCGSSPPIDQYVTQLQLKAIEQKAPIFCLAFHVDYWDHLGWKDPHAKPEFTRRQEDYVAKLRQVGKVTPCVIVNGHLVFGGPGYQAAGQIISNELSQRPVMGVGITGVAIASDATTVTLTIKVKGQTAGLVLQSALLESGLVSTVSAGENRGKTLAHDCTVRAFASTPLAAGEDQTVVLPLPTGLVPAKSRVVAYLQDPESLRIFTAHGRDLVPRETAPAPPSPPAPDPGAPAVP